MSTSETEREQDRLTMLYGRLDELRERAAARLAGVLRETGGTPQARAERDAAFARYTDRLARLAAAENGLCFGRLDLTAAIDHEIKDLAHWLDLDLTRPR